VTHYLKKILSAKKILNANFLKLKWHSISYNNNFKCYNVILISNLLPNFIVHISLSIKKLIQIQNVFKKTEFDVNVIFIFFLLYKVTCHLDS